MSLTRLFKNPRTVALMVMITLVAIAAPVTAAVLVQRAVTVNVDVAASPITLTAGGDATSSFLTVTAGTFSNDDSGDAIGTDTLLADTEIDFTCFAGDRVEFTDVLQVENNSGSTYNIGYELDLTSFSDTFGDSADLNADADIYIYTSQVDSSTALTTRPLLNATDWDQADFMQVEVVAAVLGSTGSASTESIATQSVPTGEQRQIALVVDCGENMADEVGVGTGTFVFRVTANE